MKRGQSRIRVLVADDHPLYRDGVARAIRERPDLELVGEVADGRRALDEIREDSPDVALLDFKLPELTGTQIARAVSTEHLPTRVLVLSAYTDSALVYEAVAAGARGYVSKDAGRQTICNAITAVARGRTAFSEDVQGGLAEQVHVRHRVDQPRLTPREREILALTADGLSGPQVARKLYLSLTTVKTHLQNIYEKLGVSDRAAAVAEAMRQGLLQ